MNLMLCGHISSSFDIHGGFSRALSVDLRCLSSSSRCHQFRNSFYAVDTTIYTCLTNNYDKIHEIKWRLLSKRAPNPWLSRTRKYKHISNKNSFHVITVDKFHAWCLILSSRIATVFIFFLRRFSLSETGVIIPGITAKSSRLTSWDNRLSYKICNI